MSNIVTTETTLLSLPNYIRLFLLPSVFPCLFLLCPCYSLHFLCSCSVYPTLSHFSLFLLPLYLFIYWHFSRLPRRFCLQELCHAFSLFLLSLLSFLPLLHFFFWGVVVDGDFWVCLLSVHLHCLLGFFQPLPLVENCEHWTLQPGEDGEWPAGHRKPQCSPRQPCLF